MHHFTTRRRIEFIDTDMKGIVHFSRYFIFMETAEHLFLESLGENILSVKDGRPICWPRVRAACQYKSPARFGDNLDIHLDVVRRGASSVDYAVTFELDGVTTALGEATVVCCYVDGDDGPRSTAIPERLARRFDALVAR